MGAGGKSKAGAVMNTPDEPTIIKILAAGLGSLVSLRFLTGTFVERALMTVGGAKWL